MRPRMHVRARGLLRVLAYLHMLSPGALRTSIWPCPVDSHADLEVGEEIWVAAEKIWTSENIRGDGSCGGE